MIELNKIYNEDCLIGMSRIPDKSVDMILCDLPYGTTSCKWDVIIPFKPLWEQYERVIKDNGAIVLTAAQPFTSALVMSNPKLFKYDWTWNKKKATGHLLAKKQPLRLKEDILVFYKNQPTYNPQLTLGEPYKSNPRRNNKEGVYSVVGESRNNNDGFRYPKNIIEFPFEFSPIHPTQKPVALFEYLIKTYTNEGETVLDNCAGSFTTAVACENLNRKWICLEKEEKYCEIGRKRIIENRIRLGRIAPGVLPSCDTIDKEKYYNIIQDRIKSHTPQLKLIA
jgi:site-specific DNA-methyltransferase (adenine-specific)